MDARSIIQRMSDQASRLARKRIRVRSEEGSAIMETAMSSLILLTFMFGVIEAGFMLYSYHFISEAAREGARYAIVRGSTVGSACTAPGPPTCIAQGGNNTGDIATYVKNLGYPGINPNNMTVNSTWSAYAAGNSCPTAPSPCNTPGNLITITVKYSFPLTVPFIPPQTYTMSSTAAMIIQQ